MWNYIPYGAGILKNVNVSIGEKLNTPNNLVVGTWDGGKLNTPNNIFEVWL